MNINEKPGCMLCPRNCGANRTTQENIGGFCGMGTEPVLARAALHMWEEPCISGSRGSGAVFFSGCTLGCIYCQNIEISRGRFGKTISIQRLSDIFRELEDAGAHNINLVSPTPFVPAIIKALELYRPNLPILWNTGGYERVETLKMLEGIVDIYLPDMKYVTPEISRKYSDARDYFTYASAALLEMQRQIGTAVFDENGIMRRGMIIRHLVLPLNTVESQKVLDWIKANLDNPMISLMGQYTPNRIPCKYTELNRKITLREYQKVVDYCLSLGLDSGYVQESGSAEKSFTPEFDLTGI